MRIIHTSDWHLGQYFIGKSRQAEHQNFINWLLDKVQKFQIDAVVIAGDVFDTGTPPSYARELYNRFVVELNKLNCRAVILAGNHDSVATLNESRELLAYMNTDVVAKVSTDCAHQVITINDRSGEPGAILCAVPFVRPRDVLVSQAGQSAADKSELLGEAIYNHYQSLFRLAEEQRAVVEKYSGSKLPIIATGHLTAMGVKTTESVRDIYIGTLEAFPANHFPEADYIALGHIHRPQIVSQSEHIRYSGSPIPLSFDELKWQKQVLMVEFSEHDTTPDITPLLVPLFQPMAVLKGNLEQIETQLNQLENHEQTVWLSIEVETDDYLSDLQNRVENLVKGHNVEVLLLKRARNQRKQQIERKQKETLAELNPFEVFERRLAQEQFESDEQQERLQAIRKNFAEIAAEVADEQGIILSKYVPDHDPEYNSEHDTETASDVILARESKADIDKARTEVKLPCVDDCESISQASAQEGLFGFGTDLTEAEVLAGSNPVKKSTVKKPSSHKSTVIDQPADQNDLFAMFDKDQEGQS